MYTYVAYTYMYTVGICVCRVFALEGLLRLVIALHTYTHVWRIRICIALAYMYLECWREKAFLGLVFHSIPSNLCTIMEHPCTIMDVVPPFPLFESAQWREFWARRGGEGSVPHARRLLATLSLGESLTVIRPLGQFFST